MPTPAEIIAARLSRPEQSDDSNWSIDEIEEQGKTRTSTSTPSINDEQAFPALGLRNSTGDSNHSSPSNSSWGPKMKSPVSQTTPKPKNGGTTNGFTKKSKSSTIQEAFSLDVEDQLNVTRPEFIKILTYIMQDTKTNIECTTSQHTKKRTFLISGKLEDVKLAKRLVIKKLTKPVKIKFSIPSKLRSKIIGQGGKTLKPIIQQNEVKIEIGDDEEVTEEDGEEDDDLFNSIVYVTIDGDIEGSKRAKNQILTIVKEETKNLSTKIVLSEKVKPFALKSLHTIVENNKEIDFSIPDYKSPRNSIILVGERELVLKVKSEIKSILDKLQDKIIIEEVPIPKTKHQFLPIDDVLNHNNVLIELPKENETNVKFIGEKKNIKLAQEEARKVTSKYKVEILDMSKAHKGNLQHVKAVALFLNQTGIFKSIAESNDVVINVPSKKELAIANTIPIEIISDGDENKIKTAKKSIVNQVNNIKPDQTKIIDDIEPFLINKVDETIGGLVKDEKIQYVILDNVITLFNVEDQQEGAEDFDDFATPSDGFERVNTELNKLRELAANLSSVTISIDSKDQDHISGPKGTTLKSILSSVEPNSVIVKLHSNGTTTSENEIYIHGLKNSVSSVQKDIELVLNDLKEYPDGYTSTIQIPSQVISRLIGKNGNNLISLRDEFGIKIDIPELNNKDNLEKIEITIKGIKKNVEESKIKILQITKKWADETLIKLRIENQYHRRMIGSQGKYINRLQDKYNVKIRFPSADFENGNGFADSPKSKDEVTIKGPSKNVAKAEEELKELYQFEKENGFKEILQIPSKAIARVIGKNGDTIKDIADGTGIEYQFKRDSSNDEQTELEIIGSKSALKEAKLKINEIINEVEHFVIRKIEVDPKYHRDLVGQSGSTMKQIIKLAGGEDLPRHKYHKLLTIPNEGSGSNEIISQGDKLIVDKIINQIEKIIKEKEASVTEEIELSKDKHRLIIGPNGIIRHNLQNEYNITLDIPRPNDESSIIKINGLPENITKVKSRIEELTKDDWLKSIDIPSKLHSFISDRGAIFKKFKSDYGVDITHGNLTRQANKLSSSSIATPSDNAYPENEEETYKFTIEEFNLGADELNIPWRLKGSEESVDKVLSIIKSKLSKLQSNENYIGWIYTTKPNSFSKIIGPQGSKINQLRSKNNCFIQIPNLNNHSNDKLSKFIFTFGLKDDLVKLNDQIKSLIG
ncbi:SCP160 [Candida pseudojiufengensis]|uniref:SCP160 n=1 Tax=Candida pseudojiufengensis TaxID=497109 RepID=UPI002223F825|nr:SCP160 [Candida pseudojiufengensis]KAI5962185.1 SCP160 [Candida pseudojiufengensis]